MKFLVFMGVIGSGKDFNIQNVRATEKSSESLAFADPMREALWKELGYTPKNHEAYEAFKVSLTKCPITGDDIPGRKVMENYSNFRKRGNPYVWLDMSLERMRDIHSCHDTKFLLVTDCRFEYEVGSLLALAEELNSEIEFTFCNYKSDKYNATAPLASERLAQQFVACGFQHLDKGFDVYIKKVFSKDIIARFKQII